MKTKLNSVFSREDKRILLSNITSLSILHGFNYLLPLITLPYLIRILGPAKIGLLAFAQAIISYFVILTDYGFSLTATKEVSIHKQDKVKLSEIFHSVIAIKMLLLIVSALIILVLVLAIERLSTDRLIYFFSFGMVVADVLFPVWFFQGLERMHLITVLSTLAKLIFTVSIFILVREPSDYVYVPLINSVGFVITGCLSLLIVYKHFRISFKVPSLKSIAHHFKIGWHVFLSRIFVNLYSSTNTILLGAFTNNIIVGYYSIAEKISGALGGLAGPYNQACYPFLSRTYLKLSHVYNKAVSILLIFMIAFFTVLAVVSCMFASEIIILVSGSPFRESINILRILSFTIMFIPLGGFLTQLLVIGNKSAILARLVFLAFLVNITLAVPGILFHQGYGLAVAVLLVQIFINASILTYIYRTNKIPRGELEYVQPS